MKLEVRDCDKIIGSDYHVERTIVLVAYEDALDDKVSRICGSITDGNFFDINVHTIDQNLRDAQEKRLAERAILQQTKRQFRESCVQIDSQKGLDVSLLKL